MKGIKLWNDLENEMKKIENSSDFSEWVWILALFVLKEIRLDLN